MIKALMVAALLAGGPVQAASDPAALNGLFAGWRTFEASGVKDGAPDYTPAAMAAKAAALKTWMAKLDALDTTGWPVSAKVDKALIRAEMNGLDFDLRVLKPWQRDPAFYATLWSEQSDTPAHEGPVLHAPIELWQYHFPLSRADEARLAAQLRTIPPLLAQARGNLTGNARDLWSSGTVNISVQQSELYELGTKTKDAGAPLREAVAAAQVATRDFLGFLEAAAPGKTGPSGVGIDNYDWYLKHVQLSPLTWAQEVAILKRELGRAHSTLRLAEHDDRNLPALTGSADAAAYDAKSAAAVHRYVGFLRDNDILTVKPYMEPALMAQRGAWKPADRQDFFSIVQHRAPMGLILHQYHWFDLAVIAGDPNPDPIRRGPLLYNIWVSRAEGFATANEEMMLHAGLFDQTPREAEAVWIMAAQRAARGLASLYAQANLIDLDAAKAMQVARTPNGWMSPHLPLLGFEQGLYLRQPGYGSSYITGKYQTDKLVGELFETKPGFTLKQFYDGLNGFGMIPVSMIRWQWTGNDDEAKAIGVD